MGVESPEVDQFTCSMISAWWHVLAWQSIVVEFKRCRQVVRRSSAARKNGYSFGPWQFTPCLSSSESIFDCLLDHFRSARWQWQEHVHGHKAWWLPQFVQKIRSPPTHRISTRWLFVRSVRLLILSAQQNQERIHKQVHWLAKGYWNDRWACVLQKIRVCWTQLL